jgi:hypothetical protein
MSEMAYGRIEIGWAACPRWASSASSDLVDAVELLGGGWAVILIDVQGSGGGGRSLASNLLHFTREHLSMGLTPDVAAAATHQHLLAFRNGRVGASIHIVAIEPTDSAARIVGYGPLTIATFDGDRWTGQTTSSPVAGFLPASEPEITAVALQDLNVNVFANDGVARNLADLEQLECGVGSDAADFLARAVARDHGRARSDMAVATIRRTSSELTDRTVRASISVPLGHLRTAP